ncbi:hypothetical protein [Xanthomonas nasturtii]|uniref:hypothetical protein n=1 Tax=Xanthomonas nasturtii TaxID=1843581 RepID=UPI00137A91C5|nr:hypothetical protein [Xanthomonas nasturtii]WVL55234.1 hypothetical protein M3O54_012165 [Xanthomonas nasturtii]
MASHDSAAIATAALPGPAATHGPFAGARLEKSAEARIPQAIGRVAAWTTMEHDPNDR